VPIGIEQTPLSKVQKCALDIVFSKHPFLKYKQCAVICIKMRLCPVSCWFQCIPKEQLDDSVQLHFAKQLVWHFFVTLLWLWHLYLYYVIGDLWFPMYIAFHVYSWLANINVNGFGAFCIQKLYKRFLCGLLPSSIGQYRALMFHENKNKTAFQ